MNPVKGTKWIRLKDGAEVRVMAIFKGYIVVRVRACIPFLVGQKHFLVEFSEKVASA